MIVLTVKVIFCVNEEKRKEERKKREREGGGRKEEGEPSEAMRRKDLLAELGISVSSTHEIHACF